jgi:CheY-like chemotaxis protein
LEPDGHRVTVADGGQAGIDVFNVAAARGEPVVLADIGMPYVDGRKVAAAIKAASPSTPVVLVTGWVHGIRGDDVLPPHVDRLVGKPPDVADLRRMLAELTAPRS